MKKLMPMNSTAGFRSSWVVWLIDYQIDSAWPFHPIWASEVFDAWHLMLYFEFLNVSSVWVGAREFPTDDERSLEQWLTELEGLGLVQRGRSGVRPWRLTPRELEGMSVRFP